MEPQVVIPPADSSRLAAVFKAYDVRGLTPDELDEPTARSLGAAFANFTNAETVVVGRDMRTSGQGLLEAFSEGVVSQGVDVRDVGLASTDLVYFASGYLQAPAVMLTASHNPASYNGMKFCHSGAQAIGADTGLAEIRQLAAQPARSAPTAGRIQQINLLDKFVEHVHSFIDIGALRPLKIVADTANGMGGLVLPAAFNELPFELEILYEELDGTFPNHPADPLQPENLVDLQNRVIESNADVGLAFDGDADRVFLVDEKANLVSGSTTTALVASAILEREGPGPILHNLICSRATVEVIEEAGGEPIRTRVGHSYIKAVMAETGAMFGGEHSGHYYFARNYGADSGLIAALICLERLSLEGGQLSSLIAPLQRYTSSGEVNAEVDNTEEAIDKVSDFFSDEQQDRLDGLTVECDDWWFNLRPSNTEPLLRLNVEGPDERQVEDRVEQILNLFS
ncbi:MAG: phosphomannomutase/phosphoglucomutase [Acidimicrobiales bacterium]|jgi:phosphomannomutase|nr:phosphomannomutase/phosphoglucomutase [Acidimicrobiales bacterium]HJL99077.1 phosphomannomutase/phosphoglucomutase [Acidimicrobiales bacterium]